jgi:hypothetical protein
MSPVPECPLRPDPARVETRLDVGGTGGGISGFLGDNLRRLPPLAVRRNPWWAALIGLVTGPFGIAIYFRSIIDLVIGLAIIFVIAIVLITTGTSKTGSSSRAI